MEGGGKKERKTKKKNTKDQKKKVVFIFNEKTKLEKTYTCCAEPPNVYFIPFRRPPSPLPMLLTQATCGFFTLFVDVSPYQQVTLSTSMCKDPWMGIIHESRATDALSIGFIEPKSGHQITIPIYGPYYYLRSFRLLCQPAAVLFGRFMRGVVGGLPCRLVVVVARPLFVSCSGLFDVGLMLYLFWVGCFVSVALCRLLWCGRYWLVIVG